MKKIMKINLMTWSTKAMGSSGSQSHFSMTLGKTNVHHLQRIVHLILTREYRIEKSGVSRSRSETESCEVVYQWSSKEITRPDLVCSDESQHSLRCYVVQWELDIESSFFLEVFARFFTFLRHYPVHRRLTDYPCRTATFPVAPRLN